MKEHAIGKAEDVRGRNRRIVDEMRIAGENHLILPHSAHPVKHRALPASQRKHHIAGAELTPRQGADTNRRTIGDDGMHAVPPGVQPHVAAGGEGVAREIDHLAGVDGEHAGPGIVLPDHALRPAGPGGAIPRR